MAEIIRLGSLYFDNQVQEPGVHYSTESGAVSIRDTVAGKEIPWLRLGHMLVAQQCVCLNVSWARLNKDKLIYGTIIKIDGQDFLCRSMITSKHSSGNEWDKFIRKYGHSEVDVHWNDSYTLGQSTAIAAGSQGKEMIVVRGFVDPKHESVAAATLQDPRVGFRPVLEQLKSARGDLSQLIRKRIAFLGPDLQPINGKLRAVSDYDLELDHFSPLPNGGEWVVDNGVATVSRSNIEWLVCT